MKKKSISLNRDTWHLWRKALCLLCILSCCSLAALAQKRVTGTVIDAGGEAVIGANVVEKGLESTNGTITDANGRFTLTVRNDATLHVSYIGYITQDVKTGNQTALTITLLEDTQDLEEVVVVAYGVQKKASVTAAISSVDTRELKQSPNANLSVALAGRLPGLTALQSSGQPGNDDVRLYLRGLGTLNDSSPLILIDGIPRDNISQLDPNEVASVSILKDASATAVFGVRGANGVIMITTRRGQPGKSQLSVSANYSLQSFLVKADRVHSWEFAEMRNQDYLNSNHGADESSWPYTQYMIDKYKSGEDPVFYPDRDVFHDYFRDYAPQTRINANFNGGQNDFSYFLNVGYIGQGGNFKTESKDFLGYDPSYSMDRYNFRGNLDYQIARNLKSSLNIASYLEKMNTPQTADLFGGSVAGMVENMIAYTWSTPPTDPGPLTVPGYGVPENEVVAQSGQDRNTYGEINRRGYRQEATTMLNSSLSLDWGLNFITEGLSAKGLLAFDSRASTTMQGVKSLDTYQFTVARNANETSGYSPIRSNTDAAIRLSKSAGTYYYLNWQASLNYARTFGPHALTGMLLYQQDNWDGLGADLPYNMLGMVARATYSFDDRYMAEFNFGYNGSEQFAPKNRFGSFPAFSVGWLAGNEAFLKDNPIVTNLKFRASYGKTGNDKLGSSRFLYQSFITMGGGFVPTLGHEQQVNQGRMGNEAIQWEVAEKKNLGVEFELINSLSFVFDAYTEHRDQILISRKTIPILQGVPIGNIPRVNIGIVDNRGYEAEAVWKKQIGSDIFYSIKGNVGYNKNVVKFSDEVQYGEDYAYRYRQTGFSIGQPFGYQIDYSNGNGYINTQAELDNLPIYEVGGTPRLGDFKYVDINEDGRINDKDLIPIGYSSVPRISYGFSGMLNYKYLDFSFLFSGIAKSNITQAGWGATEAGIVGFFNGWHFDAWTPERYANGDKILYPALGTSAGVSQKSNSVFIMDRSFLRLKNLEIGYNVPGVFMKYLSLESARIYVNGSNLWTWDKFPVNTIDPEQSGALVYGLTRTVNFGLNLVF
jgi:TonB-linked SusC/RagA family outer membrane protein